MRQGHEVAEPPSLVVDRNVAPQARLKNYGDHLASSFFGPGEGALHLLLGAVVGVDEIWADQENYEVSCGKFGLDCSVEMVARLKHPVMPDANQAFALERS